MVSQSRSPRRHRPEVQLHGVKHVFPKVHSLAEKIEVQDRARETLLRGGRIEASRVRPVRDFDDLDQDPEQIQPEKRFLLALLQRAYLDLILEPGRKNDRHRANARSWIESSDRSHPGAFEVVCESLEMDPDVVRAKLIKRAGRLWMSRSSTVAR